MESALERRIRHAYELFVTGDMDRIMSEFTHDATFTNPPYAIEGGVRRGQDEVRASLQALHDEFDWRGVELEEVIEGPEGVVAILRVDARGRASGAPLNGRFFHVFRLRGELLEGFAWFAELDEAREAAGL